MSIFIQEKMSLDGPKIINCLRSEDYRGVFSKRFEYDEYKKIGLDFCNSEIFYSISQKNVIRGLHIQLFEPQGKIVSVLSGCVWDVIVDLRKNSGTFGKWEAIELTENNGKSLYIPKGFAHGFLAKADNTIMLYQCQGKYNHVNDSGIKYDDPILNIKWSLDNEPIISEKDKNLMTLNEFVSAGYDFMEID